MISGSTIPNRTGKAMLEIKSSLDRNERADEMLDMVHEEEMLARNDCLQYTVVGGRK